MAAIYFWVLCALVLTAIIIAIRRPAKIYEYPYFMAAVFAIFIIPQTLSLLRFPGAASESGVEAVLLMACLCLGMCYASHFWPRSRWIIRHTTQDVCPRRLFHVGLIIIVLGLLANYWQEIAAANLAGGPWTGTITIYNFIASALIPGFAIALWAALNRGGIFPWVVVGVAGWPSVEAAIFYGRRETLVSLLVIVGLTLFYKKRLVPPRLLLIATILFAMLFIPATELYRSVSPQAGLTALEQVDFFGNFNAFLEKQPILELRNAAVLIDLASLSGKYEFGAGYWDQLVWRFVPAQILGGEFKQGLMFQAYEATMQRELWIYGYKIPVGTTVTGLGDAFMQFGYAGSLFFFLLGVGVGSLWKASLRPTAIFAQLLYVCTMTSAMRAVTHQTVDYLPGLVFYLIVLGPAIWYSALRKPAHPASDHFASPSPVRSYSPGHEGSNSL